MKPNAVFYDIEIEKAILGKGQSPIPGIEYCAGFDDHANAGVSVLCAYDFANELPLVYCKDNLAQFQTLVERADWLIGFNNLRFDNQVLRHNGINVPEEKTVDLLREIWRAEGLNPDVFDPRTHGGYGLDMVCIANFGSGKTGNGALAPVEWQRGQIGKVISYCHSDVQLTARVWRRIINLGELKHPKTNGTIKIELPQFNRFKADQ